MLRLILVTGPPATGKTTLAHAIARAVPCPVISRDEIKEGMVAGQPTYVAVEGDEMTRRTFEVFFETLRTLLTAGVTVVGEAAFQHAAWDANLGPLTDSAALRLVRCATRPDVARRRFEARLGADQSRRAHADASHDHSAFEPLTVDHPTLDVDTTDGYRPALDDIVAFATG